MRKDKQTYAEWVAERQRAGWPWTAMLSCLMILSVMVLRGDGKVPSVLAGLLTFALAMLLLIAYGINSWRDAEKKKKKLQERYEAEDMAMLKQHIGS